MMMIIKTNNINSNHHSNISSNYFNDNNNNLSKNSKPTSVIANYDNISDHNSNHHDSSNISNNDSNHSNTSSSNFNNCNTSNHSSNISDNDSNNINSDNNCNKNKGNNNKEQNTASPNKHKTNANSRVKRKTKKPKANSNSNNNSDNNNNSNNNNSNNNNNSPNNENHSRQVNNARNTVFILGDSIIKNVNGYLLTKKLRHKKLIIKVRSFSGAKVSCVYDHIKPTIREFNPNHIILHVGTNELKSSKTASQISRSVIDLALSLKSETNAVMISLIVPRKDNLNNKVQEVNSRLIHVCGERDIAFIDHTDTIDNERHLNESKVHLNKSGH